MKKSIKLLIIFGSVTALLLLIGLCLFPAPLGRQLKNHPEVATLGTPASAPSGKYILVVVSGNDGEVSFQSFQILNQSGQGIYAAPDRFRSRDTTFFLWDQEDRIWVYNGDLGTFIWEKAADSDNWIKISYADRPDLTVPEYLIEQRPNLFSGHTPPGN
jgi:hypothetical protein